MTSSKQILGVLALAALLAAGCGEKGEGDKGAEAVPEGELSPEQRDQIARLRALGYAAGDEPARDEALVTVYDQARAQPGLNLYSSEHAQRAFLVDMTGRPLHVWQIPFESGHVRRLKLLPGGDLLVLAKGAGMARLDRASRVLWRWDGQAHHDFELLDDGRIYLLDADAGVFPRFDAAKPIRNELVTELSPQGTLIRKVSMLHAFLDGECCDGYLDRKQQGDIFHSNTIEVLDGRLADKHPAFARGNVLLSLRSMNAVTVLDMTSGKMLWGIRDLFRKQHHPTILANGNMLVFDNEDHARGRRNSRVIEFDPFTLEIRWEFHATKERPFYSSTGGTSVRLENGNTLITETRQGRALEVSPEGEIVWSFVNPARVGPDGANMSRIFELQRLSPQVANGWLGAPPPLGVLSASDPALEGAAPDS